MSVLSAIALARSYMAHLRAAQWPPGDQGPPTEAQQFDWAIAYHAAALQGLRDRTLPVAERVEAVQSSLEALIVQSQLALAKGATIAADAFRELDQAAAAWLEMNPGTAAAERLRARVGQPLNWIMIGLVLLAGLALLGSPKETARGAWKGASRARKVLPL